MADEIPARRRRPPERTGEETARPPALSPATPAEEMAENDRRERRVNEISRIGRKTPFLIKPPYFGSVSPPPRPL